MRNGDVILNFLSPNRPDNKTHGDFINKHGDNIKSVAIQVDDLDKAMKYLKTKNVDINEDKSEGELRCASYQVFGDCYHTLIQRNGEKTFKPDYKDVNLEYDLNAMNRLVGVPKFKRIDHVGFPQKQGDMDDVCDIYKKKMGFHHFWSVDDSVIASQYSTLSSTVVSDYHENIKFPIFEPRFKEKKSQIEEFLDYNGGPGAQHIAIEVEDICDVIQNLRKRGVKFLDLPQSYYDIVFEKLKEFNIEIKSDLDAIRENNILIDFDEKGYLLQIFTAPVLDRPTLFFEFIERKRNQGFGEGNFQRLFLAIEEEQRKRGNLV